MPLFDVAVQYISHGSEGLTLWCGILISFELALFYCGKTAYEIISGETNCREFFQKELATIGVGGLFYMIIELFLKNVGMLK